MLAARRAQRFTVEGPLPWPVVPAPSAPHPDAPYTLDLRRYRVDRPMPAPVAQGEGEDDSPMIAPQPLPLVPASTP